MNVKLVCIIITDTNLVIFTILCSQNGCGEVTPGNITLVTLVTIVNLLIQLPMETKVTIASSETSIRLIMKIFINVFIYVKVFCSCLIFKPKTKILIY